MILQFLWEWNGVDLEGFFQGGTEAGLDVGKGDGGA